MAFNLEVFEMPAGNSRLMIGTLIGLLLAASISDLVRRRIPNVLILVGLLCAGAIAATAGWAGIGRMTAGVFAALFIFLPVYGAGVMAAGDVKLLSIVGGFFGVHQFLVALLFIFVVGGVLALVFKLMSRIAEIPPGMPYGVAVLGGVLSYLTIIN